MSRPDCLKCDGPIPEGRRADSAYCSTACKRAGEYERRRLQRRLTDLETGLANLRHYRLPRSQLVAIQGDIAAAEARLRHLLSDPHEL